MFDLKLPRHISTLPFSTDRTGLVRWVMSASPRKRTLRSGLDRIESTPTKASNLLKIPRDYRAFPATHPRPATPNFHPHF
jgi:hypothetical protein